MSPIDNSPPTSPQRVAPLGLINTAAEPPKIDPVKIKTGPGLIDSAPLQPPEPEPASTILGLINTAASKRPA